jgi:hypothetical protein
MKCMAAAEDYKQARKKFLLGPHKPTNAATSMPDNLLAE